MENENPYMMDEDGGNAYMRNNIIDQANDGAKKYNEQGKLGFTKPNF